MLRLRRGDVVRVHLGFRATRATVRVGTALVVTARAARVLQWRATRAGLALVAADAEGDASYLVRLRLS